MNLYGSQKYLHVIMKNQNSCIQMLWRAVVNEPDQYFTSEHAIHQNQCKFTTRALYSIEALKYQKLPNKESPTICKDFQLCNYFKEWKQTLQTAYLSLL